MVLLPEARGPVTATVTGPTRAPYNWRSRLLLAVPQVQVLERVEGAGPEAVANPILASALPLAIAAVSIAVALAATAWLVVAAEAVLAARTLGTLPAFTAILAVVPILALTTVLALLLLRPQGQREAAAPSVHVDYAGVNLV